MAQPYKKRKYGASSPSSSPMAIDRPSRKLRYRTTSEKKWFDTLVSATSMPSSGALLSTSINLVSEGNGVDQMAGRKIVITRLQMRVTLQIPSAQNTLGSLQNASQYRLCVILDRQCNGASATISNVFQDNDLRGYNNLSTSKRFKILKEFEGTLQAPTLAYNTTAAQFAQGYTSVDLKCYL